MRQRIFSAAISALYTTYRTLKYKELGSQPGIGYARLFSDFLFGRYRYLIQTADPIRALAATLGLEPRTPRLMVPNVRFELTIHSILHH